MTYMIVSKLIIQTLYTALFQFKCCDSSIDLDEISLPSSTVIEGLLQEHPSLLSLSDVQEAVSVSKSTQECLKPATATEIDVENQVFIYKDGENCVKGDQVFSDGRRISTNDHLHLLARSPQVLADATFSVTPRVWSQTFIIS